MGGKGALLRPQSLAHAHWAVVTTRNSSFSASVGPKDVLCVYNFLFLVALLLVSAINFSTTFHWIARHFREPPAALTAEDYDLVVKSCIPPKKKKSILMVAPESKNTCNIGQENL